MKSTTINFLMSCLICLGFATSSFAQDCMITLEATTPAGICLGDEVSLAVMSSGEYEWNLTTFLDDPNATTPTATPTESITYIVSIVNDTLCTASDTLEILVDDFNFPIFPNAEIDICQGSPLELVPSTLDRNTEYTWSPEIYLNDPSVSNPISSPEDTTTYKLIATSERGFCQDSAEITVNIIPIDVNIIQGDTIEVCLPASAVLSADLSDVTLDWAWFPQDTTLPNPFQVTTNVMTTVSRFYGISITDSETGCVAYDSIYVRVDSLPFLDTIIGIPFKEIYCVDDEILLFSRSYTHGNFPDITHEWMPDDGSYKDGEINALNAQIKATSTKTFTRITENHACRAMDTIRIPVVDPNITVTPMDTSLCPGEQVDVLAVYEPDPSFKDFEWMPEEGLSCTECDDPTITPNTSSTWTVQGEYMGCPITGSANVNVFNPPGIGLTATPGNRVAVGTEVTITAVTNSPESTFMWEEGNSGLPDTGPTIMATSNTDETRTYTVIITDANGCIYEASIEVEWFIPPFRVEVPKAFIPDGESENKIFMPLVEGVATLEEILVFNRFGQLVYEGIEGWDGTYNGGKAPSATYMYLITVLKGNSERERYKGDVTLLR